MRGNYMALLIGVILCFNTQMSWSQQDSQYTQYMYNTLSINPAYAGSREGISILGLYRNQWVGLDGAPETQTFSIHAPIGEKIGLGFNIINDEIFISNETYFDINFSYKINLSVDGQLAFGLKAGGHLLDIDPSRANTGPFDKDDIFSTFNIDKKFSPQIGAGVYYYSSNFYLGFSVPNILTTKHFDDSGISDNSFNSVTAEERLHYNLITGYVFNLNNNLKFKPAALVKWVTGAPLQVDISANFLFNEKLTLGAAYRWDAALSALAGFQISDSLMIGFAYDRETTELKEFNDGTYEVFLRFDISSRRRMISPRFF
ncbi:MAG: type IX secretion system membrane protein PorP/SprF [Flavobacteriaceae bacterium]|nr:type IX secretion system membrane protein PorP/SprF [Flavobacteriaceae bacterium]